jgi:DUF1680 family protein
MKLSIATLLLAASVMTAAAVVTPVPDKVPCAVADRQDFMIPDRAHYTGWMGERIAGSESNRLVKLDPARLLEGYRKRPGRQSWDGEHVGKWLHAATLAWVYTGDPALRQKMDYVASELVKCQLDDGYLGTYEEKNRWTEWDVWAHKYNLIGLLTYMRYTGNLEPLPACRRMGDLLCKTFGDQPGQRDILLAGEHVGMAPTSVLEPMVLLYRFTGEPRYLEFCRYIQRSWEKPNGPGIVTRLLTVGRVDKVGNGKAYEMLSCLNGALELYRTTGDATLLEACQNAWKDIVDNRLYITGAASYGELFRDNFNLPNAVNVGETCVTVTWLQFNAQLLRLTGEARFAGQLEHVILNQLFGAQRPDCAAWGYYVQMEGIKPYSDSLDGHCCLSSGPRGVALIPTFASSVDADGAVVNLYEAGSVNLVLRDGSSVTLATETLYPSSPRVTLRVTPDSARTFSVKLRVPAWCRNASIQVNGKSVEPVAGQDGYVKITRPWNQGDVIVLEFPMEPRLFVGNHLNQGKVAFGYGPLILAADDALLKDQGFTLNSVAFKDTNLDQIHMSPVPIPAALRTWPGSRTFEVNALARKRIGNQAAGQPISIRLIPFADAGATKTPYRIWLPLYVTNSLQGANLLANEDETRSREGNVGGSITDGESSSYVVTWNNQPANEDWFAVNLGGTVSIRRVVYMHGKSYHDGGWFDAAAGGKPKVQVLRKAGGNWETIGELAEYPATTATSDGGLKPGQAFTFKLSASLEVMGVRVIGVPAHGDNDTQAFTSCAELQAFGD